MKNKTVYLSYLSIIAAVSALFLSSCAQPATAETYYAKFIPDMDKIISMSVSSEYASVKERYVSVYDYVETGENLIRFDKKIKEKHIEDLEYSVNLYTNYLATNEINLAIYDLSYEYNQQKYEELSKEYGDNPDESELTELGLLLKQNELNEKSREEVALVMESNQNTFSAETKLLNELKKLPEYYQAPESGYIVTLNTQKVTDTDDFYIGTMIPAKDVILEVDIKNKEGLTEGQTIQIKFSNQWVDMTIFKINDKLLLKFSEKSIYNGLKIINFLQPQYIELSQ